MRTQTFDIEYEDEDGTLKSYTVEWEYIPGEKQEMFHPGSEPEMNIVSVYDIEAKKFLSNEESEHLESTIEEEMAARCEGLYDDNEPDNDYDGYDDAWDRHNDLDF